MKLLIFATTIVFILSCSSADLFSKSKGANSDNDKDDKNSKIATNPYCSWGCSVYNDGCNTCHCQDDGLVACTKMFCETYGQPYCLTCKSNTQWNECGSPCVATCDDPDIRCVERCQARCECPDDLPLWNGTACVAADDCPENLYDKYCNNNCKTYYDGCNTCECGEDGLSICTLRFCEEMGEDYCITCESNMKWNDCGSYCTKTCEYNDFECAEGCKQRCECPDDYPIWDGTSCIKEEDCVDTSGKCDPYCLVWFDGCNDCSCKDGVINACTEKACLVYEEPYCKKCKNDLVWDECITCFRTCDNTDVYCAEFCQSKGCACPSRRPFYDTDSGKCKTKQQCNNKDDCCKTKIKKNNNNKLRYKVMNRYCAYFKDEDKCNNNNYCQWSCE